MSVDSSATCAKIGFVRGAVRDYEQIKRLLEAHGIDALVHLAFLLDPIRDEEMYDVNGNAATLRAASDAGTKHVLAATSATAYGAWPDNPKPTASCGPGKTRRSCRCPTATTRSCSSCTRTISPRP